MEKFSETLSALMKSKGVNAKSVCEATGIPKSSLSEWSNGRTPKLDESIVKLAQFFDVSVEYLITGKTIEKKIVEQISNEIINQFTTIYSGVYRITLDKLDKDK